MRRHSQSSSKYAGMFHAPPCTSTTGWRFLASPTAACSAAAAVSATGGSVMVVRVREGIVTCKTLAKDCGSGKRTRYCVSMRGLLSQAPNVADRGC